eukprot:scaffold140_cov565-Prasinococcus_capsulatus_cf.AAC.2
MCAHIVAAIWCTWRWVLGEDDDDDVVRCECGAALPAASCRTSMLREPPTGMALGYWLGPATSRVNTLLPPKLPHIGVASGTHALAIVAWWALYVERALRPLPAALNCRGSGMLM